MVVVMVEWKVVKSVVLMAPRLVGMMVDKKVVKLVDMKADMKVYRLVRYLVNL